MTIWWLVLILGTLSAAFFGFVWLIVSMNRLQAGGGKKSKVDAYSDMAEEEASHLFNKEFREELRNRGRLRFEKIIDENAMFMKQDLDLTISQLNEYMKKEISGKLELEFADYAKAMKEAQELALDSLRKTAEDVETQRAAMATAMQQEVAERETNMLRIYEENMAKIIEHYLLASLGDQLDLKAQLPYIISEMEANKKNIMEDMRL
jgi:hypothetical protein